MIMAYLREQKETRIFPGVRSDAERKLLTILKVLSECPEPCGSTTIARELQRYGVFLSERAIRYYLKTADERGYTQPLGREGRMLTLQGVDELRMALASEQIGFILEKLELLAFNTNFNPQRRTGYLPINTSLIKKENIGEALEAMEGAFKAGICVSELVAIAPEGKKLGSVVVPSGKVGFATVCSVVVNGVLLKSGVPIESKFGGVLEVRNSKPRRFVAIITYSGTSLDPSEQFIRARMLDIKGIVTTGNGKVLANFREIPAPSRTIVEEKITLLHEAGIDGVYAFGKTSEPVCQVAVGMNRVGIVLVGGLNPLAAVVEAGIEVENIAESGLIDYQRLVSFWKLRSSLLF